jgi:hypothetical protein
MQYKQAAAAQTAAAAAQAPTMSTADWWLQRVGSGAGRKWCCVCICVYFVRLCVSVWGVGQVGNGVVCVSVCIACVCE